MPTSGATISRRARHAEGPREETSLLGFVNVLLRHRQLIAICCLASAAIFGLTALQSKRMFFSFTSFTVRGSRPQISGIAARLGLTAGVSPQTQTPAFYGDLVTSRAILRPVSRKTYTISTPKGAVQGTLASVFGIHEKNPEVAASRALDVLTTRVAISEIGRTGVIRPSARAERPEIAQQILQNMLTELDIYNLSQRRERAAAERAFVERRFSDAGAALALAERQLSNFLLTNRDIGGSPLLRMENDRLERAVRMRQQIYTGMAQSLEQAKVEEVRDLPTISVIDPPEAALSPERPLAIRRSLLGLIAGLLIGIVLAFLRERAAEVREAKTRAYAEFSKLKTEALGGMIKLTHS
jgi:uncharacterized protein involved in exopolysaccharide biosynthesis